MAAAEGPARGAAAAGEPGRIADPAAGGCPRWPEGLRLRSSQGELVRGRCGSTNQCDYCAKLGSIENAELLALDALAGVSPEVWAVLTTREPTLDMRRFYRSRELVLRALRRRWPACEAACLVEYTTGHGVRSGGRRRPHWNLLLKGIPAADVDAARAVIVGVWCRREDAEPQGQWVDLVSELGGLMRYIALHFQKSSQAPPPGWRGHRFITTRGYLEGSTAAARAAARASLRHDREVWRALRRGLVGQAAEDAAQRALAIAAATTWEIVHVDPSTGGARMPASPRVRPRPRTAAPAAAAAVTTAQPASEAGRDGDGPPERPAVASVPAPARACRPPARSSDARRPATPAADAGGEEARTDGRPPTVPTTARSATTSAPRSGPGGLELDRVICHAVTLSLGEARPT